MFRNTPRMEYSEQQVPLRDRPPLRDLPRREKREILRQETKNAEISRQEIRILTNLDIYSAYSGLDRNIQKESVSA